MTLMDYKVLGAMIYLGREPDSLEAMWWTQKVLGLNDMILSSFNLLWSLRKYFKMAFYITTIKKFSVVKFKDFPHDPLACVIPKSQDASGIASTKFFLVYATAWSPMS